MCEVSADQPRAGAPATVAEQDPFRSLAETTPDAIVTANASDDIVYVNPAAERLLGYAASEMVGRPVTMIVPEAMRELHHAAFLRYVETGNANLVGRTVVVDAQRRDGSLVPVELSLGAAGKGQDVTLTAVIRDISERVKHQRNVAAQLAVTAVLAGMDAPDGDSEVVGTLTRALGWQVGVLWRVADDATLRMTELWQADPARTEAFAQVCRVTQFRRGEGIPGEVWQSRQPRWLEQATQEVRFVRTEVAAASGLNTGVSLPLISEGEVLGVLEVFTSAVHPLDAGLRDMLTAVASQISENLRREEHAAELARSNAELEHFAQMVSHDLSEPLLTIAGYCDLIMAREATAMSEQHREFMEAVRSSAARGREMLDSVLSLARYGPGPLQPEPVDAGELVADVVTTLSSTIAAQDARVEVADLPTVHADRTLLGQVFQNLISNAIKFRGEEAPFVRISAEQGDEGHWCFAVADNGQGIAEGAEVFAMFARPAGQKQGGMGLGLAICEKIVRRHGGRIWFDSQPGAGTTFFFTISQRAGD